MELIEVLDGGLLTTVQDAGRFGYQRYGVPVSGALDTMALRAANRLAGNAGDEAALEMTLLGPRLRFRAAATIAIAGADLGALLDDRPLPAWESVNVPEGATLWFSGARDGLRAYLAVAGGLDVPPVLGSRSTYLRSRLGGYEGRALQAGDVLRGARVVVEASRRSAPGRRPAYGHEHRLRVLPGPQDDRFSPDGLHTFLSSAYSVTPQSDRMGCRLAGPAIRHCAGPDIVSDGSPLGAVQVAGDGQPIVLMADRGTAGGYTKIATVISVDVCRLAQAAPGDTVRFEAVNLSEAHQALCEQAAWLEALACPRPVPASRCARAAVAAAVAAQLLDEEEAALKRRP